MLDLLMLICCVAGAEHMIALFGLANPIYTIK